MYNDRIALSSAEILEKELIWDNHSLVMFDPDLIPEEMIRTKVKIKQ